MIVKREKGLESGRGTYSRILAVSRIYHHIKKDKVLVYQEKRYSRGGLGGEDEEDDIIVLLGLNFFWWITSEEKEKSD